MSRTIDISELDAPLVLAPDRASVEYRGIHFPIGPYVKVFHPFICFWGQSIFKDDELIVRLNMPWIDVCMHQDALYVVCFNHAATVTKTLLWEDAQQYKVWCIQTSHLAHVSEDKIYLETPTQVYIYKSDLPEVSFIEAKPFLNDCVVGFGHYITWDRNTILYDGATVIPTQSSPQDVVLVGYRELYYYTAWGSIKGVSLVPPYTERVVLEDGDLLHHISTNGRYLFIMDGTAPIDLYAREMVVLEYLIVAADAPPVLAHAVRDFFF